jgi:hypothetical protein
MLAIESKYVHSIGISLALGPDSMGKMGEISAKIVRHASCPEAL